MTHPLQQPAGPEAEAALVARAQAGDRQAFEALYRAHAGPLYRRVLMPLLGEAAAAEDALAETFVAALRGLASYRDQGAGLWPWLARIARNKAMDMHRARARSQRIEARLGAAEPAAPAGESPAEALFALLESEAQAGRVRRVLSGLHARYCLVLELRFLEGLPREECARRLEVKSGTFDVLVFRALRAFGRAWAAAEGSGERGGLR